MLAIISMLVLQSEHGQVLPTIAKKDPNLTPLTSPRSGNVDYFSLKNPATPSSPIPFAWARIPPSPKPLHAPSVSSSNSSRGSWSSLFNTGTVRQFMTGVQDTFKDGLLTPLEIPLSSTTPEIQVTGVTSSESNTPTTDSSSSHPRKKRTRNNSTFTPTSVVSKSWSVSSSNASRKTALPASSTGDKRLPLRFLGPSRLVHEKRVVFEPPTSKEP